MANKKYLVELTDGDLSIRPVFQPDITVFEMSFW